MASSVQKLLKRSQVTRIITSLHNPQAPNLTAPRVFHQPHLIDAKPDSSSSNPIPIPFLGFPKAASLTVPHPSLFYPSFPFGFCLNPISSAEAIQSELDDDVSGESGAMWADSVKKKRKKKMNKHKYKKLRKRLRRQS